MKPRIFFPLLFLLPFGGWAQLQETFSTSDLSAWSGDRGKFVAVEGLLQLSDTAPASANEAYLSIAAPTSPDQATVWEFFVRLDFAPSTSNLARVYLAAESADLRLPQAAYYVQVGGVSGDTDALVLHRQEGSSSTPLISGRSGAVAAAPAVARVRVRREPDGRWLLLADYSGGRNFQEEGSATDTRYLNARFFGVFCRYSSTRARQFFFDDVLVDPIVTDRQPPVLQRVEARDAFTVLAQFDEALDPVSAADMSNYQIDRGIGSPGDVLFDPARPAEVVLELDAALENLQSYNLAVSNIKDLSGNALSRQQLAFSFLDLRPPAAGDLLLTEIMADPTPARGPLPAVEYLELYNRSNKVIQLRDLRIGAGSSPRPLPDYSLLPGAYVALCEPEAAAQFVPPALGVSGFPGLSNSGATILLLNAAGDTLIRQFYSDRWYRDSSKTDGGWSLERLSTEISGDCPQNWAASVDPAGGTPGKPSSLASQALETQAPRALRAGVIDASTLFLFFDEAVDPSGARDLSKYQLDNFQGEIAGATLNDPQNQQLTLRLNTPLQPGQVYTLRVSPGIADCLGNPSTEERLFTIGLPEIPGPGDLVINELLFNPSTGGKDFIEIYNRSEKVIELQGLLLENGKKTGSGRLAEVSSSFLILPGKYVVLTESPADIQSRYQVEQPEALLANAIPSLDSDAGNLSIRFQGLTLDSFDYDESLHSALLDNPRGVSLERLDPDAPTQSRANWHSAAATAGFATPTARNSQFLPSSSDLDGIIALPNERFSPDGDGFEDVLLIEYQLEQTGYLLNLKVFDALGRPVRTLAENQSLASRGNLLWDGSTDEGSRARLGIYILWFELFTPEGSVRREKKTCVLAGQLAD